MPARQSLRPFVFTAALLVFSTARADWVMSLLDPPNTLGRQILGGSGLVQGGVTNQTGFSRACFWAGTLDSWIDLHPTGALSSTAYSAAGNQQVGFARLPSTRAVLWQGSADSYINLHPLPNGISNGYGTDGASQVGDVFTDTNRAALWRGSAESWVSLHPNGVVRSSANAVLGETQVGWVDIGGGGNPSASMWSGTAESWVNLNPLGAQASVASCLTATRQGGHAMFDFSNPHAGFWSGTAASFQDLHPTTSLYSQVLDMDGNVQVGMHALAEGPQERACIWFGSAASMVDLHYFTPTGAYYSSRATAVGTDGVNECVYGTAWEPTTGVTHAVVWRRPIEEAFSFSLNKATVAGQNSVQGTIKMDLPSVTSTIFSTYDNSSLVTTPASVTLSASTITKNFQITVAAVNSPINTTIYAKRGFVTKSQPLTLSPLVPTAMAFTPNPVTGGETTVARIVINGVAGPGGRTIAIFDNSPFASVPSTVTVPAGASQVTFPVSTAIVTSVKIVTLTARVSAGEKTGTFRIDP